MSHIWIIYKHGGQRSNFTQILYKTVFVQVLSCITTWKGCTLKILTSVFCIGSCNAILSIKLSLRIHSLVSWLQMQAVADVKEDSEIFQKSALVAEQTHNDYHELIEITYISWHHSILLLASLPIRFVAPGAMHQVRWMSAITRLMSTHLRSGCFGHSFLSLSVRRKVCVNCAFSLPRLGIPLVFLLQRLEMTFNFWSLSWHTVQWMLQFLKLVDSKHGVLWQFSLLWDQRQNCESNGSGWRGKTST